MFWGDGTEGVRPVVVHTIGVLLQRTKEFVVVVRDAYWDRTSGEVVTGGRLALPTGMIIKTIKLGEVWNAP